MREEAVRVFDQESRQTLGIVVALVVILAGVGACSPSKPPDKPKSQPSAVDATAEKRAKGEQATPVKPPEDSSISSQIAAESNALSASSDLGRQLYLRNCAACHGERGDGQGIAAAYVFPKPRDLRAGKFRLVSTANSVPSRDDLHAVLLRGMPGSSMPPWKQLSQADREALVDEIMRLRADGAREFYANMLKEQEELTDEELADPEVQQEIQDYVERFTTPGDTSPVPEISAPSDDALARGKAHYAKNGCLQCHGKDGKGDATIAMFDDEKFPTAPRDFTSGIFKGGHDPASLYRRIAYGMPGTPMPNSKLMKPEEMVDLVHYLRSMSTEAQREAAILQRERIVVRHVSQVDDFSWTDAPAVALRMTPLWWRNDADPGLQVQAMHDGKAIAVRISWRDDTVDRHATQSEAFEDAVALELFRGEVEPFIGMGSRDAPVDVWFWDADRQSPADIEDQYPRVVVDIYPFSEQLASTTDYRRPGTQLSAQPEVSLPALASGNQIVPSKAATGGSDLAGGGPGSVTFRIPKSQVVEARGDYQEGRWSVHMKRKLAVASDEGVSLEPGSQASIAFAVWNGAKNDRDGQKLITIWNDLILEK